MPLIYSRLRYLKHMQRDRCCCCPWPFFPVGHIFMRVYNNHLNYLICNAMCAVQPILWLRKQRLQLPNGMDMGSMAASGYDVAGDVFLRVVRQNVTITPLYGDNADAAQSIVRYHIAGELRWQTKEYRKHPICNLQTRVQISIASVLFSVQVGVIITGNIK